MSEEYRRTWETRRGGRSASDESRESYYGTPVIKAPHWNWLVIVYFFLGGISSAAHVIGCIAELIGGRTNQRIERVARYLSLAALIPSPILLILDLGRPERFHHMLRVLKLRSPMSVGTWGLSVFGLFVTLSALIQAAQDGLLDRLGLVKRLLLAAPHKTLNVVGSFFGFFVGGYTGVLLGITAVPIWAKNHLLLGPLFLCSALSSASAALTLVFAVLRGDSRAALRRLGRIDAAALAGELGLILAARANLGPVLSRPIRQGRLRHVFRFGVLGTGIAAPLLLQLWGLLGGRHSRLASALASLCTLVGGFCVRYAMVRAGHASAEDPASTFEYTK
jgi:formate-dependent nitrite reductase membrane component NrfD